jgi:hypothetical protein
MAFFHLLSNIHPKPNAVGDEDGSPRSSKRRRRLTHSHHGETDGDETPIVQITLLLLVPMGDAVSLNGETVQMNIERGRHPQEFAFSPMPFWDEKLIGLVRRLPIHGGAVRWSYMEKGMAAWAEPYAPYH